MKKNDGGPAFPLTGGPYDSAAAMIQQGRQGLSMRDYFAAKALQGMCSGGVWPGDRDADEMSRRCYLFADAMLKAREQ